MIVTVTVERIDIRQKTQCATFRQLTSAYVHYVSRR